MGNKITISILFVLFNVTFGHEVEFYPGKSSYDNSLKGVNKLFKTENIEFVHKKKWFYAERNRSGNASWRAFNEGDEKQKKVEKRAVDAIFHGHPKTKEELWHEHFLNRSIVFDQTSSLIKLINNITLTYLNQCVPVILYDKQVTSKERYLFQNLLKSFHVSYLHGFVNDDGRLKEPKLLNSRRECLGFILFLEDVKVSAKVLGRQSESKVVVVARSSQWAVQEFLTSPLSRSFVNLLVIGQSFQDEDRSLEAPYILYTHKLYADGLGASKSQVLTSWAHGKFCREVDLFPPKMTNGYSGHRFLVAAANQPPFVFRRIIRDIDGGNHRIVWDGIEIRLLNLLADRNNFSIEYVEPRDLQLGPGDAVAKEIIFGRADIGVAGMYITKDRAVDMDLSFAHSQDCAAFVTLMSTALPRYRAILGPFHWHVWVALTFIYLVGILPLAFSDKHSLRHLLHNSGEIENMFWYVFGTFTNCFTFVGRNSWSRTTKITTRLLIGWYWVFTIIITSCYTGSIIAFVTLPTFPDTVDSIQQLLRGFYRVGTLDRGGWERWFFNSSDPDTNKLLNKMEFVPNVHAGIRNTTRAFFWSYAFLGSQAELEYIIQSNFTFTKSKRTLLHISNECFVPFGVTMAFPNNSLYTAKLSSDVRKMSQGGLLHKIVDEVRWEMQRSKSGHLLSVGAGSLKMTSVEEKGLTLEDTQGMFLLLGAGYFLATVAFISEWMGGFTRYCRNIKKRHSTSNVSREDPIMTPESRITYGDITMFSDDSGSRLHFRTSTSIDSRDSFEGKVIAVTEESIIVHNEYDVNELSSLRSSSFDLDIEVKEIFKRDAIRRKLATRTAITKETKAEREETASEAFGDPVYSE